MGEWVIGAFINIIGSIGINFGTNLLKLGHDQRERLSILSSGGSNEKLFLKPIIYFQSWRFVTSCCSWIGSVCIKYCIFVLCLEVMVATAFVVSGNIFLVSFGNHQSPVYTPEQLTEKYSNLVFLLYCLTLLLTVAVNQYIYRKGEIYLSVSGHDFSPYWRMLLPLSYATVSGAVGSCSVLFAKSLSNMLRLTMSSNYHFHSWFAYSMLLLFFSTAGFWMARLNEGLSLFDAVLIVPMFQIAWTLFSICTGFVYFQEYQVFDTLRITMFLLGMALVFIGISLLAPDDPKGDDTKDSSCLSPSTAQGITTGIDRVGKLLAEENEVNDVRSFVYAIGAKSKSLVEKAKATCLLSLGLSDESISASSVLVMPMVSSGTIGFRGTIVDHARLLPPRSFGWSSPSIDGDDEDDEDADLFDPRSL